MHITFKGIELAGDGAELLLELLIVLILALWSSVHTPLYTDLAPGPFKEARRADVDERRPPNKTHNQEFLDLSLCKISSLALSLCKI